ncbi:MAG TPA: MFS transporter [Xanthobacteraceae bacterium]|nr:MFS transporter [Xanthobacteraceae bacterium]
MATSLRPIVSLLIGVALLLAGAGLQITLLPLRGSAEGFGTFALGVIGSAYYVGFVTGCLTGPYVIVRAGHIRAFTALVALAAAAVLAYGLAPYAVAWAIFRGITGFCLAGFYLVIESWLNDRASNETRGFVMSSYVAVNLAALAVGQMLVTLYPIDGYRSFMLAGILTALAIVPVALTRSAQPAPITIVRFRPRQLYEAAPVSLVSCFMIGISLGAFWALGPLSVGGEGFSVAEVAGFMSIAVVGGAVAQYPVGRMSDRIDRRLVLLALLVGSGAVSLVLGLFAPMGTALAALGFLFGALAMPGYSMAAAHGYDKTAREDMVPTGATMLLANGLGSMSGPIAAAGVMSFAGPRSLFLFIAGTQVALAGFVFYRTKVQAPPAQPDKTDFDLATTSQVGAVTPTEELNPADEYVVAPEPYAPPPEEETR